MVQISAIPMGRLKSDVTRKTTAPIIPRTAVNNTHRGFAAFFSRKAQTKTNTANSPPKALSIKLSSDQPSSLSSSPPGVVVVVLVADDVVAVV